MIIYHINHFTIHIQPKLIYADAIDEATEVVFRHGNAASTPTESCVPIARDDLVENDLISNEEDDNVTIDLPGTSTRIDPLETLREKQ